MNITINGWAAFWICSFVYMCLVEILRTIKAIHTNRSIKKMVKIVVDKNPNTNKNITVNNKENKDENE